MADDHPIDHKDKLGQQRREVFAAVVAQLGIRQAQQPTAEYFVGEWTYGFVLPGTTGEPEPFCHVEFRADGSAPIKAVDGSFDEQKGRWHLLSDKRFLRQSYIEAMPEYGIDELGYDEEHYHLLLRDADSFILFNGDGSLIKLFTRQESPAD